MAGSRRHSHRHSHHSIRNILNDFIRKVFGGSVSSAPHQDVRGGVTGIAGESQPSTGVIPDSQPSGSETPEHHVRKPRRKRNRVSAYIMRRLDKLADRMEARREERRKRKFLRQLHRRHRKERRSGTNIFKALYKKYLARKPRRHGYDYYATEGPEKEKLELKRQRRRLAFFSINSAILFVLTYLIAYLTYQLAVMFAASRWG